MSATEITGVIVDASLKIHRNLGPGLFESVCETALAASLERRGLHVERQVPVRFSYDGIDFDDGFRMDLFVERCVVVEIKSVERLAPVHTKQILTYLRLSDVSIGLILNFGAGLMKEGIKRVINDFSR